MDKIHYTSATYQWVKTFDPNRRILKGRGYRIAKRVMDMMLVILASPVWIPVMLIVALVIKVVSPKGDVLFTQDRTGRGGRRFSMYKFRTMVPNAEELKNSLLELNELQWPDFKISNDPRIIPGGRFLRKSSLDELPQLFNVLKGDMSLVGPRPTSFSPETYKLWQTTRLDVMPGITGLWQISGRGSTEFDERLRLDIAYIERRSITLDIQILLKTVMAVIEQRGAK